MKTFGALSLAFAPQSTAISKAARPEHISSKGLKTGMRVKPDGRDEVGTLGKWESGRWQVMFDGREGPDGEKPVPFEEAFQSFALTKLESMGKIPKKGLMASTELMALGNEAEQLGLVDDVTKLSETDDKKLSELAIEAFKARYTHENLYIYTDVGRILVAINPFKDPGNATHDWIAAYKLPDSKGIKKEPHTFKVARAAVDGWKKGKKPQAVLVAGESGAGKTESAKLVFKYLTDTGGQDGNKALNDRIMSSNVILEAFGNAKTVHNNNSSRFGKFVELKMATNEQIYGANVRDYLLETNRVVSQNPDERNYHIFFMMARGKDKGTYPVHEGLHYLAQGCPNVDGFNDVTEYNDLITAFKDMGFSHPTKENPDAFNEIDMILRIVAGIAQLGDAKFEASPDGEGSKVKDFENPSNPLRLAAEMFGIDDVEALGKSLTTKPTKLFVQQLDERQAGQARDGLAMFLYQKLFTWIVQRINVSLAEVEGGGTAANNWIGVLDIAGFENFKENSLEQLFINLANENLQQFFNAACIEDHANDCRNENVEVPYIPYDDNTDIMELIEDSNQTKKIKVSLEDRELKYHKAKPNTPEWITIAPGTDITGFTFTREGNDLMVSAAGGSPAEAGDIIDAIEYNGVIYRNLLEQATLSDKAAGHLTDVGPTAMSILKTLDAELKKDKTASDEVFFKTITKAFWVKDKKDKKKQAGAGRHKRFANPHPMREDSFVYREGDAFEFIINHYAGAVKYKANGFLDKNTVRTMPMAVEILGKSANTVIGQMLAGEEGAGASNGRAKKTTVSRNYSNSLKDLISLLEQADAHFIRCVKPNKPKTSGLWEEEKIVPQLENLGIMAALKIHELGFSVRLPFEEFLHTFVAVYSAPEAKKFLERVGKEELADLCRDLLETARKAASEPEMVDGGVKWPEGEQKNFWDVGKKKVMAKAVIKDALDTMSNIRQAAALADANKFLFEFRAGQSWWDQAKEEAGKNSTDVASELLKFQQDGRGQYDHFQSIHMEHKPVVKDLKTALVSLDTQAAIAAEAQGLKESVSIADLTAVLDKAAPERMAGDIFDVLTERLDKLKKEKKSAENVAKAVTDLMDFVDLRKMIEETETQYTGPENQSLWLDSANKDLFFEHKQKFEDRYAAAEEAGALEVQRVFRGYLRDKKAKLEKEKRDKEAEEKRKEAEKNGEVVDKSEDDVDDPEPIDKEKSGEENSDDDDDHETEYDDKGDLKDKNDQIQASRTMTGFVPDDIDSKQKDLIIFQSKSFVLDTRVERLEKEIEAAEAGHAADKKKLIDGFNKQIYKLKEEKDDLLKAYQKALVDRTDSDTFEAPKEQDPVWDHRDARYGATQVDENLRRLIPAHKMSPIEERAVSALWRYIGGVHELDTYIKFGDLSYKFSIDYYPIGKDGEAPPVGRRVKRKSIFNFVKRMFNPFGRPSPDELGKIWRDNKVRKNRRIILIRELVRHAYLWKETFETAEAPNSTLTENFAMANRIYELVLAEHRNRLAMDRLDLDEVLTKLGEWDTASKVWRYGMAVADKEGLVKVDATKFFEDKWAPAGKKKGAKKKQRKKWGFMFNVMEKVSTVILDDEFEPEEHVLQPYVGYAIVAMNEEAIKNGDHFGDLLIQVKKAWKKGDEIVFDLRRIGGESSDDDDDDYDDDEDDDQFDETPTNTEVEAAPGATESDKSASSPEDASNTDEGSALGERKATRSSMRSSLRKQKSKAKINRSVSWAANNSLLGSAAEVSTVGADGEDDQDDQDDKDEDAGVADDSIGDDAGDAKVMEESVDAGIASEGKGEDVASETTAGGEEKAAMVDQDEPKPEGAPATEDKAEGAPAAEDKAEDAPAAEDKAENAPATEAASEEKAEGAAKEDPPAAEGDKEE